jgi:hypothetical protein
MREKKRLHTKEAKFMELKILHLHLKDYSLHIVVKELIMTNLVFIEVYQAARYFRPLTYKYPPQQTRISEIAL